MAANTSKDCTPSSGNIFADLGLPTAEQDRYKADLIHSIAFIIKEKGLSQADAAKALKIDQPKVSNILHGRISGFSTDRLLRFLALLGHSVRISIGKEADDHGSVTVECR